MATRRVMVRVAALAVVVAGSLCATPEISSAAGNRPSPGAIHVKSLSSGGQAWFNGPLSSQRRAATTVPSRVAFGTNVDANNPQKDLAAGQSETAIAAAGSTVVAAWNDVTALFVQPSTDRQASGTGVGVSIDGARNFRDLIGLRNNRPNQQWFGDPTVVRIDSHHFAVGSLYLPPNQVDCGPGRETRFQLAVEMLTVRDDGTTALGLPVVTADGGDLCPLLEENGTPAPDLAFLDKEWLSYDPTSRMLAMSYTRFFFGIDGQSGTGQIELVRARVPANPADLSASNWSRPITIWSEETDTVNTGAYVSVARNGDAYVAWERNVDSNLFNGHPYVYIHAAKVGAGASSPTVGGQSKPRVVSLGQRNSNGAGGVKSLDAVVIAGFNRGIGQDFPRIAVNAPLGKVVIVWNDASAHPLGDIWMRSLPLNLGITGAIAKVNDDNSYALHFLPAVSVRADGSIATSWYDRRLSGPDSARTDYFGEIRSAPTSASRDFRITTGSTDWTNTSSLIVPNFGDYTDNASSGSRTYFTWSDGRIGVPQPFVDRR
jgi:hypothetical protein